MKKLVEAVLTVVVVVVVVITIHWWQRWDRLVSLDRCR